MTHILQIRKLKFREIKYLTEGYTANNQHYTQVRIA
jgi:hypothetical protein